MLACALKDSFRLKMTSRLVIETGFSNCIKYIEHAGPMKHDTLKFVIIQEDKDKIDGYLYSNRTVNQFKHALRRDNRTKLNVTVPKWQNGVCRLDNSVSRRDHTTWPGMDYDSLRDFLKFQRKIKFCQIFCMTSLHTTKVRYDFRKL